MNANSNENVQSVTDNMWFSPTGMKMFENATVYDLRAQGDWRHTTPAPPLQMMAGSADGSWTESGCGHHYHITHTLTHIHSHTGLWLQSNQQKRLWVEAILRCFRGSRTIIMAIHTYKFYLSLVLLHMHTLSFSIL